MSDDALEVMSDDCDALEVMSDGEMEESHGEAQEELQGKSDNQQRQSRAEQRSLLKERRLQKPNAPIVEQAKALWEQIRQKRMTKQERRTWIDQLMAIIKGKTRSIVFKHDASRIIQCCLKYGSQPQRDAIAQELDGCYSQLSMSHYGRFIVSKILNYCALYRNNVIKAFYGKVRQMVRHKEASVVLDEAYSQFANSQQRSALLEEFYGPEFAVFKDLSETRTIESLLTKHPLKRQSILRHMRLSIDGVLQKGSFNLGRTPILHRAIWEYLDNADATVAQDMIELLKDHLVHILHTREGARIAQYCILHASPKERKLIVKSFKTFVPAIAKEQYGHLVLLSCFECIDDTVVVAKTLVAELLKPLAESQQTLCELLRDRFAARVFLHLLSGRNKRLQPAYVLEELQQMDAIRATTCKKDDSLRRSQLAEATLPPLIDEVALNLNELLRHKSSAQVVSEAIRVAAISQSTSLAKLTESISNLVKRYANPSALLQGTDESPAIEEDFEEAFNAVKKLKTERDTENKVAQGLDMESSILANRCSTIALKNILSLYLPKADQDADLIHLKLWKQELGLSVLGHLKPFMKQWMQYVIEQPKLRAGTCWVFVALYEAAAKETQKQIKSWTCLSQQKIESHLKALAEAQNVEKTCDATQENSIKRKVNAVDSAANKTFAIQVLLSYWK